MTYVPTVLEGDYTEWTLAYMSTTEIPIVGEAYCVFHIDEKYKLLHIVYDERVTRDVRLLILSLNDYSTVYQSPDGTDYMYAYPENSYMLSTGSNLVHFLGGISISFQSYKLFARSGGKIIEVWRGGSEPVWSRDVSLDFGELNIYVGAGMISQSGEYIALTARKNGSNDYRLLVYEGS